MRVRLHIKKKCLWPVRSFTVTRTEIKKKLKEITVTMCRAVSSCHIRIRKGIKRKLKFFYGMSHRKGLRQYWQVTISSLARCISLNRRPNTFLIRSWTWKFTDRFDLLIVCKPKRPDSVILILYRIAQSETGNRDRTSVLPWFWISQGFLQRKYFYQSRIKRIQQRNINI